MGKWEIGDVTARSGFPASTIRYYEQIELPPLAERVNGRRQYDESILKRLGIIRLAQKAGFTIAEIQMLLHHFPVNSSPSERWQIMAAKKLDELEEQLKTIEAMKEILAHTLTCQCKTLEECGSAELNN